MILTIMYWVILSIIALYITIFVVTFIYNGYLLISGKMTREELNYKVHLHKEKQKLEQSNKKKRKSIFKGCETIIDDMFY